MIEKEKKEVCQKAAEFSNFCQRFKMKWWEKREQIIDEDVLDELAMIAFEISKDFPMSVSEWKNVGVSRGYWDYFKNK